MRRYGSAVGHRGHARWAPMVVGWSALALMALMLGACGDDDGSPPVTTAAEVEVEPDGDAPASDDAGDSAVANPMHFGVRFTGEPGTLVRISGTTVNIVDEENSYSYSVILTDEPIDVSLTVLVKSAELQFWLHDGGSAMVQAVRGGLLDPFDMTAGMDVVEVLGSVEVTSSTPVELAIP